MIHTCLSRLWGSITGTHGLQGGDDTQVDDMGKNLVHVALSSARSGPAVNLPVKPTHIATLFKSHMV